MRRNHVPKNHPADTAIEWSVAQIYAMNGPPSHQFNKFLGFFHPLCLYLKRMLTLQNLIFPFHYVAARHPRAGERATLMIPSCPIRTVWSRFVTQVTVCLQKNSRKSSLPLSLSSSAPQREPVLLFFSYILDCARLGTDKMNFAQV